MKLKTFRLHTIGLSFAAVAAVMVCQQTATAEAGAAKSELPPAEAPVYRVGQKETWRWKDRAATYEVVSVDGDNVSWKGSDGCDWISPHEFGPMLKWNSGCWGSGGTQTIKSREGNIFPLQVGSTMRWKIKGKNDRGFRWSRTRKCNVKGTANVTVPAGNFDTYRVVCTDSRSRWEWHFSPELGANVTYKSSIGGGVPFYGELVSSSSGGDDQEQAPRPDSMVSGSSPTATRQVAEASSAAVSGKRRITTEQEFRDALVGRRAGDERGYFIVHEGGTLTGKFNNRKLTGKWTWEEQFFCRTAKLGSQKLGRSCQVLSIEGDTLTATGKKGKGKKVTYRILDSGS